jgi:hypothetical protein
VQVTAALQARRKQRNEGGLYQTPLVMSFLRPRVRKENVRAIECVRRNHVLQHFHCIVLDDSHVTERMLPDLLQQTAHARRMHFKREVILLRVRRRDFRGCFTHAESDLQYAWRTATEGAIEIDERGRIFDAELREQPVIGAALRVGNAPLPQDVAADGAVGAGRDGSWFRATPPA